MGTTMICECGHRKEEHWLVAGGEMPCIADFKDEIREDPLDVCRCADFTSIKTNTRTK